MTYTDLITRISGMCREDGDCWVWLGCVQSCGDNPTMRLYGKTGGVRRFVLEHKGVNVKGKIATYSCGNHMCVAPNHLVAVTRKTLQVRTAENLPIDTRIKRAHKVRKITRARGVLTQELADMIRDDSRDSKEIAAELGVSQQVVWCVKAGLTWRPEITNNPFAQLML